MYNLEMDGLLGSASQFILHYYPLRYLIIGVGSFVQGEITVLISVYLVLRGDLNLGGFLLAIFLGNLIYEGVLYSLGRFLKGTPLGTKLEKKIPQHAKMQFYLHKNAALFLTISKFVVYFNSAVLILSGWTRMAFPKLFKTRFAANSIWLGVNLIISYFAASGINLISKEKLRGLEIGILLVFFVLIFGSKHILKKIMIKEAEIEEKATKIGERIEKTEVK